MLRVVLCLFAALAAAAPSLAQGPPAGAGQLPSAAANRRSSPTGGAIADQRRASPQTGTGRLNGPQGAQLGRSADRGRPLFERRGNAFGRTRTENPSLSRRPTEPRQPDSTNDGDPARIHPPQSQRPWAAERVLQNRLAAIDRMRDHALATDNPDMLQHADELEQMARDQHARMIGVLPQAPVALPGFTPLPPATAPAPIPVATAPTDPAILPPTTGPAPTDPAMLPPTSDVTTAPPAEPTGPYLPPGLHGREFGQHISEQARLYGREFGQWVSEQAKQGGTPFGRGIDRRTYEPPIVTNPPLADPPIVTNPPTTDPPITTDPPTTDPAQP